MLRLLRSQGDERRSFNCCPVNAGWRHAEATRLDIHQTGPVPMRDNDFARLRAAACHLDRALAFRQLAGINE
jgi:hypothetical protein